MFYREEGGEEGGEEKGRKWRAGSRKRAVVCVCGSNRSTTSRANRLDCLRLRTEERCDDRRRWCLTDDSKVNERALWSTGRDNKPQPSEQHEPSEHHSATQSQCLSSRKIRRHPNSPSHGHAKLRDSLPRALWKAEADNFPSRWTWSRRRQCASRVTAWSAAPLCWLIRTGEETSLGQLVPSRSAVRMAELATADSLCLKVLASG